MRKKLTIILTLVLSLLISIPVFAESAESAGNIFYADTEVYKNLNNDGDIYTAGNNVELKGEITGDVIAAGSNITLSDLTVGGNIRTASSKVEINVDNARNITSAAANIVIGKDTVAKGVYLAGGSIKFLGTAEDVYIAGETVTIDGTVNGNVKIDATTVTFGENAKIVGTIKVKATKEPVVNGDIDKDKIDFEKVNLNQGVNLKTRLIGNILSLASALVVGLIALVLCKNFFVKSQEKFRDKAWVPFVLGFATLIALPIAALISFFTFIGMPVGFISLIAYGVILYLAPVISGIVIGPFILRNKDIILSAFVGVVVVKVLTFIPFVGGFVAFAAILMTLGLFVMNIGDAISNFSTK